MSTASPLPTITLTAAPAERQRRAKRVRLLSWVSLGYMALEGGIAILAGILAGSVALIGFGADVSWLGIALSATSVVAMPYLGIAKQRLADQLGSAATKGEGCACVSDPLAGLNADGDSEACADACCSITTDRADT